MEEISKTWKDYSMSKGKTRELNISEKANSKTED